MEQRHSHYMSWSLSVEREMSRDPHSEEEEEETHLAPSSSTKLADAGAATGAAAAKDISASSGRRHWIWTASISGIIMFCLLIVLVSDWLYASRRLHIKFLAVGDWGQEGTMNQTEVAMLMARVAQQLSPDFVLSVGNNFCPGGLKSTLDPVFDTSFSQVYTGSGLQVPWHAVLGNHDYGDQSGVTTNATREAEHALCEVTAQPECPGSTNRTCCYSMLHQLNPALRERDPRWHCERAFQLPAAAGAVELFFVDTSPFIQAYENETWAYYPGSLAWQSWPAGLLELDSRLSRSSAPWKIVVAHHPVRSNGVLGNTPELMQLLEPVLERRGVKLYLSGHDHNLQHLHVATSEVHYIVSGAGSEVTPGFSGSQNSLFQLDGLGFVSVEVQAYQAVLKAYCISAGTRPVYTAKIPLHET